MTTVEHDIVKAQKIIAAAAAVLSETLIIPKTFQRQGIDAYKGAAGDTINIKVPGTLPFRTYGWRNDRSSELVFDSLTERTFPMTFGDDIYSGVALTDEQATMDGLADWIKLITAQVDAVGRGLEWEGSQYVQAAPYAVKLGANPANLREVLVRARGVLNRLRCPREGRVFLAGTAWEEGLLLDEKLNLAQNVGEAEAVASLREATIGRRFGFTIIVSNEVAPEFAYAYVPSAFQFLTAAPAVPKSAGFGATASYDGIALRWTRGFDITRSQELSVVQAYKGFQHVSDPLRKVSETGQSTVSTYEHFVRGISLELDGTDSLPDGTLTDPGDRLAAGRPLSITAAMDAEFEDITGIGANS